MPARDFSVSPLLLLCCCCMIPRTRLSIWDSHYTLGNLAMRPPADEDDSLKGKANKARMGKLTSINCVLRWTMLSSC